MASSMVQTATMPCALHNLADQEADAIAEARLDQEGYTGQGPDYSPDYFFRCSYCIKLIGEDCDVYMRHDACFCSQLCRDKGLSKLYTSLKESQLRKLSKASSGSSLTSAKSDSSLASKLMLASVDDPTRDSPLGPLARLGQKVLDAVLRRVASRAWGSQMLRTYSSGMLWGRKYAKDTSVETFFDYLPEVDEYILPRTDTQPLHVDFCRTDSASFSCSDFETLSSEKALQSTRIPSSFNLCPLATSVY